MIKKTIYEHIKVNGNLLREVSEKLPNMFIAMNEILKNSYDACATQVTINFLSKEKRLVIEDNGCGMDDQSFKVLFSISTSVKKYGSINECGRITQGSKGLGFLSVFKFGNTTTWESVKDNVHRTATMNIKQFVSHMDISSVNIPIEETILIRRKNPYTKIVIEMNDSTVEEFNSTFESKNENTVKLLKSFLDDKFNIIMKIDELPIIESKTYKADNPQLANRMLYKVNYDSNTKKLEFYHKDFLVIRDSYDIDTKRFKLNMKLEIYELKSRNMNIANNLFIFKESNRKILAPLVYVNNNLFNTYELFNPGITRQIRQEVSLPQITGIISIISDDLEIDFNAERSRLVSNSFSKILKIVLDDLNTYIQLKGSEYKFGLVDKTKILQRDPESLVELDGDEYIDSLDRIIEHCINPDFKFKDLIEPIIIGNEIEFRVFNESIKKCKLPPLSKYKSYPASINLISDNIELQIPTSQIDLRDYIEKATNSRNEDVKNEVNIFVNDIQSTSGILSSQEVESKQYIKYKYFDSNTGECIKDLIISIEKPKPKPLSAESNNIKLLIPNIARVGYKISFNPQVERLVNQINKLHFPNEYESLEFDVLFALGLRTLADISVRNIIQNGIRPDIIKNDNTLEVNVNKIVSLLFAKKVRERIAESTLIKIDDLSNMFIINEGKETTQEFGNAIRKSNIFTHSGTAQLTSKDIELTANRIGWFLIIVNEFIMNSNIKSLL